MKKYTALYNTIKDKIIGGELQKGDKIPSVRNTAEIYDVSITTVQNAYFDLCADGYVISKEKSGYYVTDIGQINPKEEAAVEQKKTEYDLTGGKADEESFDFNLWQRYIKSALRQKDRLLSYSSAKGEYDLRKAIAQYIKDKRNVITSADNIIIGAGVQPLLQILCVLLDNNSIVSFPDKSFIQGMGIFSSHGFEVHTRDKNADIIYVSPSHMTRWGDVMPIKRRLELVEHSQKNGALVIEDDYENEFLYNKKPTPSLYTLGKGNVIYISSFSAMLLPGIRISFMVLTKELKEKFEKQSFCFAQTASKTEQIALCNYIRDGHINSQTRKIRRLYTAKTKRFAEILQNEIPQADIKLSENFLQIIFEHPFKGDVSSFKESKIDVFIEKYEEERIKLIISPSAIPSAGLESAAKRLKKVFG